MSSDEKSILGTDVTFPYEIAGEPFVGEVGSDGELFIRHEKWSLMGTGETLVRAEEDLIGEGRSLKVALGNIGYAALDEESRRLLEFLDRIT